MADKPAILLPITIDATKKWLTFSYNAVAYHASIAVAEYADVQAVAVALEAAMDAAMSLPGEAIVTCAVGTDNILRTTIGITTGSATFSLLLKTGLHGFDNDDDHIGHVLGFTDAADYTGAISYESDYQAQGCWVSGRAPSMDSYDQPEHVGTELRTTLDATYSLTLDIGVRYTREVGFPVQLPEVVYANQATGANLNRDFETAWEAMIGGSTFRYCPDSATLATYTTYNLMEPREWAGRMERKGRGIRRHSWTLMMRRLES